MSSFADEQSEEIEVLQSIFPTEFEQLETPNKFKIHISPGGDEVFGERINEWCKCNLEEDYLQDFASPALNYSYPISKLQLLSRFTLNSPANIHL